MHILYNIFLNLMGFYLTCFITGFLSDLAKQSEDALLKKSINYDELERLSTTIVSNIESGLMTITRDGNIRLFNRYAEELTGKTQAEVYDVPLKMVFPAMATTVENMNTVNNGEFACDLPGTPAMVLGYGSVPFTDTHGETAGIIINFKDLTSKKQMEETLKRTDKLATLGEISARMAHEIRNPLAAMSGSVQLLSGHGSVAESDKCLLDIILRETDRLNSLITEFLTYARPVSPSKEPIVLFGLVEDILLMSSTDRRFSGITINNLVPRTMNISADANQMRQVLINLLNNAAEASTDCGRIEIEAHSEMNVGQEFPTTSVAVITVSDNGPGIAEEAVAHLFEPFWTTKKEGTGLGLAIVYRIIEEHGGTISAGSALAGGCRITITLPD